MRSFYFIAILFAGLESPAQSNDTIPKDTLYWCGPLVKEAYNTGWVKFLEKNLVLDSLATDTIPPGSYTASVQFIISKDGGVSDVKIIKNPGYHLGEKLRSVVMSYSGKWIPAEQNGRKVKSYRVQPVTYIIEKECELEQIGDAIL